MFSSIKFIYLVQIVEQLCLALDLWQTVGMHACMRAVGAFLVLNPVPVGSLPRNET